jgi:hypothetical protein
MYERDGEPVMKSEQMVICMAASLEGMRVLLGVQQVWLFLSPYCVKQTYLSRVLNEVAIGERRNFMCGTFCIVFFFFRSERKSTLSQK